MNIDMFEQDLIARVNELTKNLYSNGVTYGLVYAKKLEDLALIVRFKYPSIAREAYQEAYDFRQWVAEIREDICRP
jgi:hypothetical protein